jgi:hypothetical protein
LRAASLVRKAAAVNGVVGMQPIGKFTFETYGRRRNALRVRTVARRNAPLRRVAKRHDP